MAERACGACLSACVRCATYTHDRIMAWKWSNDSTSLSDTVIGYKSNSSAVTESLHIAIEKRSIIDIRRILDNIEDCRLERNYAEETPVQVACKFGYEEGLVELLDGGCATDVVNSNGSPMHYVLDALRSRQIDDFKAVRMLKLLYHYGCNVDSLDSKSRTALFLACELGSRVCSKALIEMGCGLNVSDRTNEFTPLYMCSIKADYEGVKILLDHGAVVDKKDSAGRTPLMATLITIGKSQQDFAISNEKFLTDFRKRISVFEYLLQAGTNVDETDRLNRTPLSIAIGLVHVEVIRKAFSSHVTSFLQTGGGIMPLNVEAANLLDKCFKSGIGKEEPLLSSLVRSLKIYGAQLKDDLPHLEFAPSWLFNLYEFCSQNRQIKKPFILMFFCRQIIRKTMALHGNLGLETQLPLPERLIAYVQ
ncbi:unnamed protein product [Dimorphilus gyrociliatus]|uniref:SOCS box domain-containing protein n=1 Tax=Dimorphilus gyrociliatus TaxID=2664684 RepID=A0A7I8VQ90_9ANNE|nr:unnamed protein product [Dimorphilus gyrociliatus]